jgi:hypothetical protein
MKLMEAAMAAELAERLQAAGTGQAARFPYWTFKAADAANPQKPVLRVVLDQVGDAPAVWISCSLDCDPRNSEEVAEELSVDTLQDPGQSTVSTGTSLPPVSDIPRIFLARFQERFIRNQEQQMLDLFIQNAPIAYEVTPHLDDDLRLTAQDLNCCPLTDASFVIECFLITMGRLAIVCNGTGVCDQGTGLQMFHFICEQWKLNNDPIARAAEDLKPILRDLREGDATLNQALTRVFLKNRGRGSGCGQLAITTED